MWYWLRRNTHERTVLLTLLIVSTAIHAGFLAWFFFGFKDRSSHLSFVVTPEMLNNNVEFVFGPVKPKAQSGKKTTGAQSASKKNQKKEKLIDTKKLDMKTSVAQKKTAKAAKKEPQKKSPKVTEKKIAQAKKDPEPAKASEPIKREPEKKAEPELKPPAVSNPISADPIALSTNESGTIQQQIGIHERGLLDEYVTFQKEIVAVWAPPPGIAHDCACLISVMVDWQGGVKDLTVEKSSGVLVYDASARAALAKLEMPRWTWGKTITITFNQ